MDPETLSIQIEIKYFCRARLFGVSVDQHTDFSSQIRTGKEFQSNIS